MVIFPHLLNIVITAFLYLFSPFHPPFPQFSIPLGLGFPPWASQAGLTSKGKPGAATSTSWGRLECGDLAGHPKDAAMWGERSACTALRTKEISWAGD